MSLISGKAIFLRRGLLYPVEPRGHAVPVCRGMGHVARAWTSLAKGGNV